MILQTDGLTKRYRSGEALAGIDLTVAEGEILALLGPSGAGKSTLLRCLNGLVAPSSGEVLYRGVSVTRARGAQLHALRREMAMVFQGFNLVESLDVWSNVLLGRLGHTGFWRAALARWRPEDRAAAWSALERVGLAGLAQQRVSQLSGGQRQRVGVARALAQQPRVILADEPVSSLDPVTARAILDLLAAVSREQGITLVLSLHDVALARTYATRIAGLAGGRLVWSGSPAALDDAALARIYREPGQRTGPELEVLLLPGQAGCAVPAVRPRPEAIRLG